MNNNTVFKISVAVLLLFSSTLMWWMVNLVFERYPLTPQGFFFSLTVFLFSFLFYLSLFCLVATFFEKPLLIFILTFISAVPLFLIIRAVFPFFVISFIFSLLQSYAIWRLGNRVALFTKIKIGEIYGSFLKSTFVFLSALLCVSFYFFYVPRMPERVHLPERATEAVMEKVFSLFGRSLQLPTEGDPQESLDWIVQESREENVGERLPESILFMLRGTDISSEALRTFLGEQQANGGPRLGISELRVLLEEELNNVAAPYLSFLPIIFATSLFLILRFIAPIFMLLAVGFLILFVKLLRKLGLIKIVTETVKAERMRI